MIFGKVSESEIQSDILKNLNAFHIGLFWRNNNTGVYDKEKGVYRKSSPLFSRKGVPDILGCYQCKFVGIEVKTPKAYKYAMNLWNKAAAGGDIRLYRPTGKDETHFYHQIIFLDDVRRYGGIGFFTYSFEDTCKKLGVKNVSFGNGILANQRAQSSRVEPEENLGQGILWP